MAPPTIPGDEPTIGMFDNIVEVSVSVGEAKKEYHLHEGLLRHYSGYFDAALGGEFAEAKTKIVQLEEDIETFDCFVLWLYTGKYPRPAELVETYNQICKLWVLAERRQIPLLANTTLNTMKDEISRHWKAPCNTVRYIYGNTLPDSKLRKFVVWVIAAVVTTNMLNFNTQENSNPWPEESWLDMLHAVVERKEKDAPPLTKTSFAKMHMCQWHQHEPNERCSGKVN